MKQRLLCLLLLGILFFASSCSGRGTDGGSTTAGPEATAFSDRQQPEITAAPSKATPEATVKPTPTATATLAPEPVLDPDPEPTEDLAPEPTPTQEPAREAEADGPDADPSPDEPEVRDYVLNKNTMKFHDPSCKSAGQIKEKNRVDYTGTREEIIEMGYEPCKNCNP